MRKHRENRRAVHYRGFKEKFTPLGFREIAKLTIRVHDRAFVGTDSMRAGFERRFQMVGGGLAAAPIERRGFKENLRIGSRKPLMQAMRRFPRRKHWKVMCEQRVGIKRVAIGDPPDPSRRDSRDAPLDVVLVAKLRAFRKKQAQEFLAHISEAHHGKVVGANEPAPSPRG